MISFGVLTIADSEAPTYPAGMYALPELFLTNALPKATLNVGATPAATATSTSDRVRLPSAFGSVPGARIRSSLACGNGKSDGGFVASNCTTLPTENGFPGPANCESQNLEASTPAFAFGGSGLTI